VAARVAKVDIVARKVNVAGTIMLNVAALEDHFGLDWPG
jgi:hypothetical protein